jgi:tetratricopeptide (TPR) repeat protein
VRSLELLASAGLCLKLRAWIVFAAALLVSISLGTAYAAKATRSSQPADEARRHKLAGDAFVKNDDFGRAADEYIRALDLDREAFSVGDRIQIARYLSWADRLTRSEEELRAVLALEPANRDARIHLARVLSWKGDLRDAIEEAEQVLKESPGNREALQIKADALQWQGNLRRAIPLYRELLEKHDGFDTRLGLSQSLLAARDRVGAAEASRPLSPATANEKNRFERFQQSFDAAFRPSLDARYSRFTDSDKNKLDRYTVSPSFWLGNVDLAAFFRHTEANDDQRYKRAEEFSLKAYTHVNESVGVGGSLGFAHLSRGNSSTFPTGELRLDTAVPGGRVGASVTREVLTDTAELIENRIRATFAAIQWTQHLSDRFSFVGSYRYGTLSDSNHLHDARLTSQYALWMNPKVSIGHRFRYVNFQRQSRGGYFDPNDYYSNRGFISFYMEQQKFYIFADIFVGQQAFRRNGVSSKDPVYGGSASLGVKPTRALAFELAVEGGQLAAAASSGSDYSYLIFGPRFLMRF